MLGCPKIFSNLSNILHQGRSTVTMTKCCEMTHNKDMLTLKKLAVLSEQVYIMSYRWYFSFLIFYKFDSTCSGDTHTFTILLKLSKEEVNGKKSCDAAICERRNWFLQCENLHSFIFVHPCLLQALWERRMAGLRSFGVTGVLLWGMFLALFQTTDLIPMASRALEIDKQGILH